MEGPLAESLADKTVAEADRVNCGKFCGEPTATEQASLDFLLEASA
jgi:hypothetical protein